MTNLLALPRWRRAAARLAALAALLACAAAPAPARQAPPGGPERVALCPAADPATGAAVAWRGVGQGRAQVAPAAPGGGPAGTASTVEADSAQVALESGAATHFKARLEGLRPDTEYVYRVACGETWSPWHRFRTAAREPKPFRFIYLGDTQTDLPGVSARVLRAAVAAAPDARLVLHAGDLTNTSSSDAEWGQWFGMDPQSHATRLCVPAAGNHQYDRAATGTAIRKLTRLWNAHFALPATPVPGAEGTCLAFDFQGVRFVVLNSMEKTAEQALWLDAALKDNPCRWTVALFHFPIFSGAKDRDEPDLRAMWKPIFDRHGVDLVLTGHDHVYGRSDPRRGIARGRTVYVLSVAGSKQYDRGPMAWAARRGQDVNLYQVVSVDGSRLRCEARDADGVLYDAFTISKEGGRSVFSPDGGLPPERLRPRK